MEEVHAKRRRIAKRAKGLELRFRDSRKSGELGTGSKGIFDTRRPVFDSAQTDNVCSEIEIIAKVKRVQSVILSGVEGDSTGTHLSFRAACADLSGDSKETRMKIHLSYSRRPVFDSAQTDNTRPEIDNKLKVTVILSGG